MQIESLAETRASSSGGMLQRFTEQEILGGLLCDA
jgi:hypothetical protein